MPAEQSAAILAWWRDDLIFGGAWFAADWPIPQGLVTAVRKIREQPRWEYVPGGYWALSAMCEVRGVGEEPQGAVDPNADPHFSSVLFLHPFDDIANPNQAIDAQGKTWTWNEPVGSDMAVGAASAKFGAGGLYAANTGGTQATIDATYPSIPLDPSGENKFTIDGWLMRSSFGVRGIRLNLAGAVNIELGMQNLNVYVSATLGGGNVSLTAAAPSATFCWCEANYDGENLRLFLNGTMVAKQAVVPGAAHTIIGARIGLFSTSTDDYGRWDDARATAGVCRHPSDATYSPPAQALPTYG